MIDKNFLKGTLVGMAIGAAFNFMGRSSFSPNVN